METSLSNNGSADRTNQIIDIALNDLPNDFDAPVAILNVSMPGHGRDVMTVLGQRNDVSVINSALMEAQEGVYTLDPWLKGIAITHAARALLGIWLDKKPAMVIYDITPSTTKSRMDLVKHCWMHGAASVIGVVVGPTNPPWSTDWTPPSPREDFTILWRMQS